MLSTLDLEEWWSDSDDNRTLTCVYKHVLFEYCVNPPEGTTKEDWLILIEHSYLASAYILYMEGEHQFAITGKDLIRPKNTEKVINAIKKLIPHIQTALNKIFYPWKSIRVFYISYEEAERDYEDEFEHVDMEPYDYDVIEEYEIEY